MVELKDYRQINAKEVIDDDGKRKQFVALGPIFYDNKLKVGDGKGGLRGIDNNLIWDDVRKGWTFYFNNYQPFIPEYCDDWFLYRDLFQGKDQIFGFKPRNVGHVQGRLVNSIPDITDINAVIYDDAFGSGMDLIICFTFRKMRKLVRIRDGFKPTVDTDFDFILKFPDGVKVYETSIDNDAKTEIDPMTAKTLGLRSQLYIGLDKNDGKDWFTKLQPIRVWDSGKVTGSGTGQKAQITPAAIAVINNATVLRKRVTAAFLASSVGDVFTDTTITYTENKDTYYGTSFATGGQPDSNRLWVGGWGDFYYSYLEWDLTGSLDANQVSAVVISLKVASVATNDNTGSIRKVISTWTEAGVTSTTVPQEDPTTVVSLTNPVTVGVNNRDEKSILSLYQSWKNGTAANRGVKIHSASNTDAQHKYYSSDDADSNNWPWIIATYAYELEQEGYRWRDDDGNETGASWLDSQDTNISRAKGVNTRLRVLINATLDPPGAQYQLEVRKAGTSDPWKLIE